MKEEDACSSIWNLQIGSSVAVCGTGRLRKQATAHQHSRLEETIGLLLPCEPEKETVRIRKKKKTRFCSNMKKEEELWNSTLGGYQRRDRKKTSLTVLAALFLERRGKQMLPPQDEGPVQCAGIWVMR